MAQANILQKKMWILQKWLNFLIILSGNVSVEGSANSFIPSKKNN